MSNNRKCDVCGKNDVRCVVASSSLGPLSFNYCLVCAAMGADEKIHTTSGNIFTTRSQYVEWSKNGRG